MSLMTSHLDPAKHPWMHAEGLRRLMNAIKAGGGELRFVGGCVRDALLGWPVGEVDLAVNLPPERVSSLLVQEGFKVVPTGIEHGTVTAVVDRKGYEITTLRHDLETDGRRAKVAFTDDWQADAARRDFTFNAIYADAAGHIYDYFDGRADLEERYVRFIGDPHERIKEDVLRILRFFRFHAWVGRGEADPEGLEACAELAGLILNLSVERVWRETSKLLNAANPLPAWILMKEYGVLRYFLPEADNIKRLETLLAAERKYDVSPSPLLRLAALLPGDVSVAVTLAQRLKLSRLEAEKLQTLVALPEKLKGNLGPIPFRRILYEYGAIPSRDAALLRWTDEPEVDLQPVLAAVTAWQRPSFPLQGNDILRFGLAPGPKIGTILQGVEDWWIDQDFKPDRAACLAEAHKKKDEIG